MSDLEKEAEEYVYKSIQRDDYYCSGMVEGFIAGANSNYAKQQVIKGKIEVLEKFAYNVNVYSEIKDLKAELKQLETPK